MALPLALDAPGLSGTERAALVDASRAQLAATLRVEATSSEVNLALLSAGVPHVFIKGAALAALWQYGWSRPEARTYTDVDVVVRAADVSRAILTLQQENGASEGPTSPGQSIVMDSHSVLIDLHWSLVNDVDLAARLNMSSDEVLDSHVSWDGASGTVSPEFTLLHVCLHAVLSDLTRPAALLDIDAAARAPGLDWERFADVVDRHHARLIVAVALQASSSWMLTPVPAWLLERAAGRSTWAALARRVGRRDPGEALAHGWSGGEFYRRTRETDAKSFKALLGSLPLQVRVQRELKSRG